MSDVKWVLRPCLPVRYDIVTLGYLFVIYLSSQRNGYEVWFDRENMSGDITDAMEEAIRLSDVIVVVFSLGYFNSVNCKKECNYAIKKGTLEFYDTADIT